MKKTIIFTVLAMALTCGAQNKTAIDSSDVKIVNSYFAIYDIEIYLRNADAIEKPTRIVFVAPDAIYRASGITMQKINDMIVMSNLRAMYNCKNKYSFVAKKTSIFYWDNKNVWSVTTTFTAQNDIGGTKEAQSYSYYDKSGTQEVAIK